MTLNPREKLIAIALGSALLIYLADTYVVEPYLAQRAQITADTTSAQDTLDKENRLLKKNPHVAAAWKDLTTHGLGTDAAEGASNTMSNLFDWSQSSRVDLQSLKPDRFVQNGDFQEIRFQASGVGTLAAIARLLFQVETTHLPLHVDEVRIDARRDNARDLSIQFTVTTLVFSPPPPKPGKPTAKGST